MKRTIRLSAVLFSLLLLTSSAVLAQSHLLFEPSPQALGRGGLYTSAWSDDPLAAMINPGMLGFLAERNRVAVGFYPRRMTWRLPFSREESFYYSARAVNAGFSRRTLRKFFDWKAPVSVGFSYHEMRLDLPDVRYVDEQGHVLGRSESYEDARGISVGVGLHWEHVQLGMGWSSRFGRMRLGVAEYKADLFTHDLGFVLRSSIEEMWPQPTGYETAGFIHPFVHPSLAYGISNLGPSYRWKEDTRRNPLPRTDALTLALAVGLNADLVGGGSLQLVSVEAGEQVGDRLVDLGKAEGHWYRNPLTDIQPVNDLVLGKYHRDISRRKGFEVALCEMVYVRWGSIEDEHNPWLSQRYNTTGWGVRAVGLLKLLAAESHTRSSGITGFVVRHLDLQYDYTTRNDSDEEGWMDGTTYQQLVLLWRY